uniref:FCP1 homology domain-containing protein n=1 Tax=Kalanchoe fedtschenkoi TaxID=63787 RepID=A0A7N0U4B6_KALFE
MPSKIISKADTSFASERTCPGVCPKSCKISKNSGPLARIPSDSMDLYLACQKNQNDSNDTIIASCEVGRNNNSDGNEYELISETAIFQKQASQDDFHQFDEGAEVLMSNSEMYSKTVNHTPTESDGIYGFNIANCNEGNDGDLGPGEYFESNGSHYRISDATDFYNVSYVDENNRYRDSSEINVYPNNISEKDTLLQKHEDVLLSFVREELVDTISLSYSDLCDEVLANSDDSWVQLNPRLEVHPQEFESESCLLGSGSADPLDSDFFNDLPSLLDLESTNWISSSSRELSSERPVTLVLDLDETLVHTTASPCEGTDFSFQLEERALYVRKRPFLDAFLERVGELFRIIIFTAGTRIYADHVLDRLDPGKRFTSSRAYRDSCIFSDESYTKDLTVLGVDLAKLAIVDNTPAVFHELQVNNGIPIKSWFGDPTDQELLSLLPFLEILADADDVRPFIAERFGCTASS